MAVTIDLSKCDGCSACVEVCPVSALKVENGKAVCSDECVDCGSCVGECPKGAISLPE